MFENVSEAIEWVTGRQKHQHPFSRFREYVREIGEPQKQLKCIHVAGTNGKGSTTNYLRSILQQAGYKVGSFTSPHLVTHLDRIRINNENIEEAYFLDIVNRNREVWEKNDFSMFEIDMLIAVQYFLDRKVDIAVFEVGLGGRLDATNIIEPVGAVITNIEMDHMQILGDTIAKIAREKAGIIKDGLTVVTFEKKKPALRQLRKAAHSHKARLILTDQPENVVVGDDISFDYHRQHYTISARAPYQVLNASAAIELIERLNQAGQIKVSQKQLQQGLMTSWPGRFEQVSHDPDIYIDGAHNENGVDQLCQAIDSLGQPVTIVFSALADKRYHQMLAKLKTRGEVIVTKFENYRSTTAENLAEGFTDVQIIDDYRQAIEAAVASGKTVIITGSLYFISLVRKMWINE